MPAANRWGEAKATPRGWGTPCLRAPHGANSTNATIPLAPRGLHAGRSAPRSERPGRSSLLSPPGNTSNALDRDGRTRSRDDAPCTVSHAYWSLAAGTREDRHPARAKRQNANGWASNSTPPGQQLERFARTQGRAAGGVQVTMDRGEEQAHGIPGGKAVKRCLDRAGSARNEPVAIVLIPSRRDHFPETPARVGQSCRKLSMSGSSGASLAIRCDKTARVSPTPKGGARVCVL